jgi:hypothetical protein
MEREEYKYGININKTKTMDFWTAQCPPRHPHGPL